MKAAGLAAAAGSVSGIGGSARGTRQLLLPDTLAYLYPNPGKIVEVYHPGAVLGYNNVDFNVVQGMFDQGIMLFTGITSSPADALASLFPGLTTSKKIAIKPNLINSSVPTRKELVKAVITRLVEMLGGYPAGNITLFERHYFGSSGYSASYFGQNVNLVVDSKFPDLGYYIFCNGKNRPYSKSLHEADYLINMPVLKDHSCGSSFNFTLSFKNHMGTVNPGGSLGIHCDKVACLDIMADSVMTTKQRIVITDGLYAIYNGGPGGSPQATPKKIFISQDPVTSDYHGRAVINALRVANNLSPKSGSYIEQAALPPYQIGVADPAQMNVITLNLPVELTSFHGALDGETVLLTWTTAAETNNAGFDIERSTDGFAGWEKVAFVKGTGTTRSESDYSYRDPLTAKLRALGTLFYRLRQVDFDGTFDYSSVVEVRLVPDGSSWNLEQNYPNPFNTETEIPVHLPEDSTLRAEILDGKGNLVSLLRNSWTNAGSHHLRWDAKPYPSGVYTCRATSGGITREIKMVLLK